jgi:hypothetical protein
LLVARVQHDARRTAPFPNGDVTTASRVGRADTAPRQLKEVVLVSAAIAGCTAG